MALKFKVVQEIDLTSGPVGNLLLTGLPARPPVGAHKGAHLGSLFLARLLQGIVDIYVYAPCPCLGGNSGGNSEGNSEMLVRHQNSW